MAVEFFKIGLLRFEKKIRYQQFYLLKIRKPQCETDPELKNSKLLFGCGNLYALENGCGKQKLVGNGPKT